MQYKIRSNYFFFCSKNKEYVGTFYHNTVTQSQIISKMYLKKWKKCSKMVFLKKQRHRYQINKQYFERILMVVYRRWADNSRSHLYRKTDWSLTSRALIIALFFLTYLLTNAVKADNDCCAISLNKNMDCLSMSWLPGAFYQFGRTVISKRGHSCSQTMV